MSVTNTRSSETNSVEKRPPPSRKPINKRNQFSANFGGFDLNQLDEDKGAVKIGHKLSLAARAMWRSVQM